MVNRYNNEIDARGRGRRSLVRAALLLGAGGPLLLPRLATALSPMPRRLRFHHTHTNEKISVVYYANNRYLSAGLKKATRFLRDFRAGEIHPIDPKLFDYLYAAQLATRSRGVFEVISGYRSATTNAMLRRVSRNVAKRSLHTTGKAIDVRLTDIDTEALRDAVLALKLGGVGYYRKPDFVHLDTGRVRSW